MGLKRKELKQKVDIELDCIPITLVTHFDLQDMKNVSREFREMFFNAGIVTSSSTDWMGEEAEIDISMYCTTKQFSKFGNIWVGLFLQEEQSSSSKTSRTYILLLKTDAVCFAKKASFIEKVRDILYIPERNKFLIHFEGSYFWEQL